MKGKLRMAMTALSHAKWIWTKGKTKRPFQVSHFRGSFRLARVPRSATLECCADSKYHLWVNGAYLGFGPARGDPRHPYYDSYEVAPHLRKGKNTVALLVQHYTDGAAIFAAVQGG